MSNLLSKRARIYAASVLARLRLERTARALPTGKCAYSVMFLQPAVQRFVEWINHGIRLEGSAHPEIPMAGMYRFLAVFVYCHQSGYSVAKGIDTLRPIGRNTPSLADTRLITRNLKAYTPTVHRECEDESEVGHGRRDATSQLEEFEVL